MKIIPLDTIEHVSLNPKIVWNGRVGDLRKTLPDDPVNPSGLEAGQDLASAVLICLETDRRVEPYELEDGMENRGWPGDGFGLEPDEPPLGSKLWLLRRRILSEDIEQEAEDYAAEALETLIAQGAVAQFKPKATANFVAHRLDLNIDGFGRDGEQVFHQKYAILWDQLNGVSTPLA